MIYNKEITICKSNQFLPNKNLLYNIYENSISEKREIIFVFQGFVCILVAWILTQTYSKLKRTTYYLHVEKY